MQTILPILRDIWQQRKWLGIQAIVIVAGTLLTILIYGRNHLYDPSLYHEYSQNLFARKFPYCDFSLEYPPFALLSMMLPQLLTLGIPTHLYVYAGIFAITMLAFSLFSTVIIKNICDQTVRKAASERIIYFILVLGILSPLLLWRYDFFPALTTLFALASAPHFAVISGLMLAIGFAAKLYPILLLPVFGLYYWSSREYLRLKQFSTSFLLMSVFSVLPFISRCPNQFLEAIQYHRLRGLQIESLAANVALLGNQLGLTSVEVVKNYGAEHLVTPWSSSLLTLSSGLFLLLFMGIILQSFFAFQFRRKSPESETSKTFDQLIISSSLIIAVFIVTNKVFSPQYLTWLVVLTPLLSKPCRYWFLGVCFFSSLVDPFLYKQLVNLELYPTLLLTARNICMIIFLLKLFQRSMNLSIPQSSSYADV